MQNRVVGMWRPETCTLTVAEIVYKGNIRDWGKKEKSLTAIHNLEGARPRQACNRLHHRELRSSIAKSRKK